MAQYEVRCSSCNVSFPVGTKKCLHCGGRIGVRARQTPELGDRLIQGDGLIIGAEAASAPRPPGASVASSDLDDAGVEEGRSGFRFGTGAIWVLVLVAGMISRMCSE